MKIFCGRHKRNLPERGKSVSAFPLPTPLRYSNKPAEAAERRKGEERCNGPLHATTTMDAVIKASLASLSLTAAVAHRLAAGSSSGSDAAAAGEQREGDELKRKAYTTLRNRYFGAYFFALFGIRIRGVTIPLFTGSESGSGIVQRLKIFGCYDSTYYRIKSVSRIIKNLKIRLRIRIQGRKHNIYEKNNFKKKVKNLYLTLLRFFQVIGCRVPTSTSCTTAMASGRGRSRSSSSSGTSPAPRSARSRARWRTSTGGGRWPGSSASCTPSFVASSWRKTFGCFWPEEC